MRREPDIERTKEQHAAMYAALNKITPDKEGVSLADLTAGEKYCSDYVCSNLGSEKKELTDEVKKELDKLMDKEVAGIKKWTRAEREASLRANRERA